MRRVFVLAGLAALGLAAPAIAATAHVKMALAGGDGASVGSIDLADGNAGAVLTLHLHGLTPGPHGFHIHQNGSCAATPGKDGAMTPAGAAGGHLDPAMTGKHEGPDGMGHLGDLPLVTVASDGTAGGTLTAKRITDVSALKGRSLMIHVGGDNYSDMPAPLGGGGVRLACGVID
jgi:Cu-Zn family superoxide dismutase